MSDNVKIKILEQDATSPRGATQNSDIAYIPGFATTDPIGRDSTDADIYAKKNIPILCNSVDEFKRNFGSRPYTFTEYDVSPYGNLYTAGDVDKSYIYAIELLNAGMPVVYENIVDNNNDYIKISSVSLATDYDKVVANNDDTFTYTPEFEEGPESEPDRCEIEFAFRIPSHLVKSVYDAVTVSTNFPQIDGYSIDCGDISYDSPTKDTIEDPTEEKFTIEDRTIRWQNITENDIEYAVFSFPVTITATPGSGHASSYTFSAFVVEGLTVPQNDAVSSGSKIKYFYDNLEERLKRIEDKSTYSVKYITSGAYPTFITTATSSEYDAEYAEKMIACAMHRGDAVALIDASDIADDPLSIVEPNSIYSKANSAYSSRDAAELTYAAMFAPWGSYTSVAYDSRTYIMPASFGYLMCLAKAIKTSPNWLAMAGVTRGVVPNLKELHVNNVLSNVIAENYQPKYGSDDNKVSINAITNIRPYGLTMWGNRTLAPVDVNGATASNFLNTRNMISDIKKLAYSTAKALMFEQDSDTLWLRFKSGISPLLDQLKSGHGIADYKIIKSSTRHDGSALTRGELAAVIKVYPLYAIEYFEITVHVSDDVSVE